MATDTFSAHPVTLAALFGAQRRYEVPRFQRDYGWEAEQWEDLWVDVSRVAVGPAELPPHFLGPLVLQGSAEPDVQRVVDGQQRLITLSLLALAVIHRVELLVEQGVDAADNAQRAQIMRASIVSTREATSLRERPRMRLNDEDNGFFATRLLQQGGARLPPQSARRPSERRLLGALHHFRARLDERLPPGTPGEALARFLDRMLRGVRFIEIEVSDDTTAFMVFETLNARGLALTTADLTKNFLFSLAAEGGPGDLADMQAEWRRISELVGPERVSALLFTALSASAAGDLSERRVFQEVKRVTLPPAGSGASAALDLAFALMRRLEEAAALVAALESPEHERWSELPDARAAREAIRRLQLVDAEPARPLLVAAAARLNPDELGRLLDKLPVLLLRAQLTRAASADLRRVFQRVAREVQQGRHARASAVLRSLRELYPPDEAFRAAMEQLAISASGRRKRLLRHILARIEAGLSGVPVREDDPELTIEHILPERQAGASEGAARAEEWVNRLGNLTLLELDKNKALRGVHDWERKQAAYRSSGLAMTRSLQIGERWSPDAIRHRQAALADRAVALWRLELDEPGALGG